MIPIRLMASPYQTLSRSYWQWIEMGARMFKFDVIYSYFLSAISDDHDHLVCELRG